MQDNNKIGKIILFHFSVFVGAAAFTIVNCDEDSIENSSRYMFLWCKQNSTSTYFYLHTQFKISPFEYQKSNSLHINSLSLALITHAIQSISIKPIKPNAFCSVFTVHCLCPFIHKVNNKNLK